MFYFFIPKLSKPDLTSNIGEKVLEKIIKLIPENLDTIADSEKFLTDLKTGNTRRHRPPNKDSYPGDKGRKK